MALLDDVIGGYGGAVTLNLDESPLVDELTDRLEVGCSPGDVGLTDPQHVGGRLVQLGEHLSTLEDHDTLGLAGNLRLDGLLGPECPVLCLPLPPLQDGLWDSWELSLHSHGYFS